MPLSLVPASHEENIATLTGSRGENLHISESAESPQGLVVIDEHGSQYRLTEIGREPFCHEAEDRFCFHDPDKLTKISGADLVLRFIREGEEYRILISVLLSGVTLNEKSWNEPTGIVMEPMWLRGLLAEGGHEGLWIAGRPFDEANLGAFMYRTREIHRMAAYANMLKTHLTLGVKPIE